MTSQELARVAQSGLLSVWDAEGRVHLVRLDTVGVRDALRAVRGAGGAAVPEERPGGVPGHVADGHHREYDDSWMEMDRWAQS